MEGRETAIVLGLRRHGETSVIAEVMTPSRGRHLGIVRGGRSRWLRPVLQPGNTVEATWRARLDEQLGTFAVEPVASRAARLMESAAALDGVQLVAGHLRLLPERDPHPRLFETAEAILDNLNEPVAAAAAVVAFEVLLLEELGFGLDLSACAVTGERHDLRYVSPKSGRAVGREAGAPYADRLLAYPRFLAPGGEAPTPAALADAFRTTGFFLSRHVWEARGTSEPAARRGFVSAVTQAGR